MIKYFHSIIFDKPKSPLATFEYEQILIDSLVEKIEKKVDMKLIIEYHGHIYGPCIRNILSDNNLKEINVYIPPEYIFSYIEELKNLEYTYNPNSSFATETYYMSNKDKYSVSLIENMYEFKPDFDIDILMYDGYVLSNIDNYNIPITQTYQNIKNKIAKVISTSYDYSLKEEGYNIIL
jgi:hypothetical protein